MTEEFQKRIQSSIARDPGLTGESADPEIAPKKRKKKLRPSKRASPDPKVQETEVLDANDLEEPKGLPKAGNALKILKTKYAPKLQFVEDLILEGLTFLAGVAKVGKTTLLMQFLQAICNPKGGEVLGRRVFPAKVLLISLEEDDDAIQERMVIQGWAEEECANLTVMEFATFMEHIGPLHTPGAVDDLIDYVTENGFTMVVIDNFTRAFLGLKRLNDNSEVTVALTPIHDLAKSKHISIVFIDHHGHSKGILNSRGTDPCDNIMNSSAKGQVCDTAIGFFRDGKGKRILTAVGRRVSEQGLKLEYDETTQKNSRVMGDDALDLTSRQARIMRCVRTNYPLRLKKIADITGIASSNAHPICKDLVSSGLMLFDVDKKLYSPVLDAEDGSE